MTDLGDLGKCKICGAYSCLRGHKCDPIWYVMFAEDSPHYYSGDIPWKIRAHDAQDAAEKFAERFDSESADYTVVGGEPITITVWPKDTPDNKQTFTVNGAMIPEYWAEEEVAWVEEKVADA